METYIGIDYGGTKLLIGEVDGGGRLLSSMRFETGKKSQGEIVKHLLECLGIFKEKTSLKGRLLGAGIGIIGISDCRRGVWCSMNHEPGEDIPLASMVSEILGVPAAIDNDVRSGVTAELLWGAGKYSRDFIYLSVGTGLAAGMVVDGRIIRGANQNAGEIGHITVKSSGDGICLCGRPGCAELTASGSGISRNMKNRMGECSTRISMPKEDEPVDVREVFALARQGDCLCKKVAEEAAMVLSEVIENLVRTTDPDTVVLGGGVMQDTWFLEQVKCRLHPSTVRGVKNGIRLSDLKPAQIGVIGAAAVGKLYVQKAAQKWGED